MKRIFTLIAAAVWCSTCMFAEKVKIGDLYYNLNGDNKTAEVTYENEYPSVNYAGLTTAIIPDSVQYADNYYAVTAIGINAFHSCPALQSVVIPDNVQTIGGSAFYLSEEIKSITLGSGVQTIGGYAFFGCETLVTITIPDNVQSIGENVFAFCSSLQSVTIGKGVQTIGEGALENCPALAAIDVAAGNPAYCSVEGVLFTKDTLTLLQHPTGNARIEYTIPANVQTIGENAFYECQNLQSVTIGNGVQTIGASAFSECQNLQSVTIGNGVQTIGDVAFGGCSALTTIYNYATTPLSIEFYTFSQVPFDECTLYVPAASLAAYQAADGWNVFGNIQAIPAASGTYKIGDLYYELDGNNLTAQVTYDEDFPSSNYAGLTTIVIPDSVQNQGYNYVVTAIGEYAFYACSSLQSVVISDSVKTIGDVAFLHCTSLQSINVAAGNQKYCSVDGVLFTKDTLTLIQYPMGNPRTEYTIPANVQETSVNSFNGSQYLQSVTIPASVQTIGLGSFVECTNLQSVINYATTPQTADEYLFDGVDTNACALYVPAASLSDYQAADVWKEFFLIQTIESIATGIENGEETKGEWTKVIRNGQLLIDKNGKTYNALGVEIK